jgi:hypothetical protein
MSKKNSKSRSKAYVDFIKEQERLENERRKQKQEKRDTNRMANNLIDEISEIALNTEKEERMTVEKPESKKKQKVKAKKHVTK